METSYQWFTLYQDQLLLEKNDNTFSILTGEGVPVVIPKGTTIHTISTTTGMVCKAFYINSPIAETPEHVQIGLRTSYDYLSQEYYQAAGKVHETLYWDRSNRYCPACGTPLIQKEPIMRKCSNYGREIYPAILVAILALVCKEDPLLLIYARNFKDTSNSLATGFLEIDETLEECMVREVKEGTGLDVKSICYFGSQPWPYPSGLVVESIANYTGGDVHLQGDELSPGNFYTRDHLLKFPHKLSLVRKMID